MVKYAAARSGSKYVVGREGWKNYGSKQANVWMWSTSVYQHECDDLEIRQNGMRRWALGCWKC